MFFAVMMVTVALASCNNDGVSTKAKFDSLGKKFDSTAEKLWDSTKEKAKDIKEKIEDKLDQKDSADKKADTIQK